MSEKGVFEPSMLEVEFEVSLRRGFLRISPANWVMLFMFCSVEGMLSAREEVVVENSRRRGRRTRCRQEPQTSSLTIRLELGPVIAAAMVVRCVVQWLIHVLSRSCSGF